MPFKAVLVADASVIVIFLGLLGTQGNTSIVKTSKQLVE